MKRFITSAVLINVLFISSPVKNVRNIMFVKVICNFNYRVNDYKFNASK